MTYFPKTRKDKYFFLKNRHFFSFPAPRPVVGASAGGSPHPLMPPGLYLLKPLRPAQLSLPLPFAAPLHPNAPALPLHLHRLHDSSSSDPHTLFSPAPSSRSQLSDPHPTFRPASCLRKPFRKPPPKLSPQALFRPSIFHTASHPTFRPAPRFPNLAPPFRPFPRPESFSKPFTSTIRSYTISAIRSQAHRNPTTHTSTTALPTPLPPALNTPPKVPSLTPKTARPQHPSESRPAPPPRDPPKRMLLKVKTHKNPCHSTL